VAGLFLHAQNLFFSNSHQNSHSPKIKMAADLAASYLVDFKVFLAPQVGLEPTTLRLTVEFKQLASRALFCRCDQRPILSACAGSGAGEEEDAFAGVLGEGGGEFELSSGFVVAAEFTEEVGADAGEEVVSVEEGVGGESFYEVEGGLGAVGHGDGYGAIELDDRGWGQVSQFGIEGYDAGPVG